MLTQFWTNTLLLAADAPPANPANPGNPLLQLLLPLMLILVFFWLMMWRPQQKEQAKRRRMLDALKKNDRVLTVGGIYGVVTNVHREADEVTLKVDEATNAKLRVTLGAISRVLTEETSSESSSSSS